MCKKELDRREIKGRHPPTTPLPDRESPGRYHRLACGKPASHFGKPCLTRDTTPESRSDAQHCLWGIRGAPVTEENICALIHCFDGSFFLVDYVDRNPHLQRSTLYLGIPSRTNLFAEQSCCPIDLRSRSTMLPMTSFHPIQDQQNLKQKVGAQLPPGIMTANGSL